MLVLAMEFSRSATRRLRAGQGRERPATQRRDRRLRERRSSAALASGAAPSKRNSEARRCLGARKRGRPGRTLEGHGRDATAAESKTEPNNQ